MSKMAHKSKHFQQAHQTRCTPESPLPEDIQTTPAVILVSAFSLIPEFGGVSFHPSYLIHTLRFFEEYKAEASRSPSDGVQLQSAVYNFAKLREVILQILLGCIPAKATNEHFPVKTSWSICRCVLPKILHCQTL